MKVRDAKGRRWGSLKSVMYQLAPNAAGLIYILVIAGVF
jgi:hypothetical protein